MDFYSLILIALALSLDAFGVTLCVGLNRGANVKYKMLCVISSAFFQFLFALIGAYAGFLFNTYIASIPEILGGIIIGIVGILMLKEGMEEKEECALLRPGTAIVLGISVSIDAMVVGFTALHEVQGLAAIFESTLLVGVVTLIMCLIALAIAKYLSKIELISKYADYIGGIILILFGFKMIFL